MNLLAGLQQRFQDYLMSSSDAPLEGLREDVRGHLEIYVNAYWGRLREALADNYPVLYRALGDDAFRELAVAYLNAHPSGFRSIRWFGDQLAAFIAGNSGIVPHPALLDIARMDWAMRGAFDAADATPLAFQDLSAIPPEQWPELRFSLCPSFRMLSIEWGIESLWHALNDDENAETEAPLPHPHTLIIWRAGLETRWRTLLGHEAVAISILAGGGSFAQICATLQDGGDQNAATSAANMLATWLGDGLLVSVVRR